MRHYLFKSIVFNCRKATTIALKKEDGSATLVEQVQLFYHSLYCNACRQFLRQSRQINARLAVADQQQYENPSHHLPEKAKDHMKERINQLNN